MIRKYYAQLTDDNVVMSVGDFSGIVVGENMVELESLDFNLLDKVYVDGEFIEPESQPESEPKIDPAITLDEKIDLLGQMMVELYLKDGEV